MRNIVRVISLLLIIMMLVGCGIKESSKSSSNSNITNTLSDLTKYYGNTFGQGDVVDVYVNISDDDWNDIKENAKDEEYHSADITVNGTLLKNVGFRTKGFSSLTTVVNSDSDRYGFKIKTDKYEKKQTLNGLNKFVLNASFADPSYMREYFTYAASQYLGAITPYMSYVNLYINDELFGFYTMIESYDDSFVERVSEDSENAVLYKADSENCSLTTNDDGSGFEVQYGEDADNKNIKNLITTLNQTTEDNKADLEKILDVESVLKATAVNTVMGNYDSYSGSKAHNYYLLYDEGKFSYVGWDYNMSIGGFSEDNGASVTVDINDPLYNVNSEYRPLIEKLLAIPEYKEEYLSYVNKLIEYFSDFESKVETMSNMISKYVENDPSAFYTYEQYQANLEKTDTDLSQIQNNMKGPQGQNGQQPPQMPDGQQPPQMPTDQNNQNNDGQTTQGDNSQSNQGANNQQQPPQMPDGQQPPQMPTDQNNQNNDGQTTQGDNSQSSQGANNQQQPPQMPDGQQLPQMPDNQNGDKGGMGSMINNNAVSIVDYITQRITNIKEQLSKNN